MVMVVLTFPSSMSSFTPVNVTFWAVSQSPVVNVTVADPVVTSPVSEDDTLSTTLPAGSALRTNENVSVPASSVTMVAPLVWAIVNPAVSSSLLITPTLWFATLSNASALEPSTTARVIPSCQLPSSRSSLIPVTVTVCALFQLPLVNVRLKVSTDVHPPPVQTSASLMSLEVTDSTTSLAG